ncbi:MAG: 5-amino-6-(D-ribitylamino)uracil--L-tyrosine 4-hydroxyphenyl transferase CofH [Alphaproteobacteria bacterium]
MSQTDHALRQLLHTAPLAALTARAAELRDIGHGARISYSRKVFIPLTRLCRDVCHYCTFAERPRAGHAPYMSADEVLAVARAGIAAGCREALFTLGDKPELRYAAARTALAELGHPTTISYLAAMCELVVKETGLLPHVNPGVMSEDEIALLRGHSISQGLMLESGAARLCERGGVHFGSPDKHPAVRLETIRAAGRRNVPFTTGILIGIGETRDERLDALFGLRDLHAEYGHIQEIIVQNFRAKPATRMAAAEEPDLRELVWTLAAARLIFGAAMNIQCPPNLSPGEAEALIAAGINDWGGVSPVTPDFVNPEAPWPAIDTLARETARAGKQLVERLATYPSYCLEAARWMPAHLATRTLRAIDSEGFARTDEWAPGRRIAPPPRPAAGSRFARAHVTPQIERLVARARAGTALGEPDIATLFAARDADFDAICAAADDLRRETKGDTVSYVVNRNINYTNICYFRCRFCAFSKGKLADELRGRPYDLAIEEIVRRACEAWDRGATEVCLQGGIHPDYTGQTYLDICRAVKAARPALHVHAFSPLEVAQGAKTLGIPVEAFLRRLQDAGLGSLPGTAAEILDDEVRKILCPDKLDTLGWLGVVEAAHRIGLKTTATIMFGHIETPRHWARHLLAIRKLQERSGGFTEFVPLPFVHMEAPIYLHGQARSGPTFREAVLMHAVARLALHPVITNIQASWVKLGTDGVAACLHAGVNDLGGTLMNESISRAAGTEHGQELPPAEMEKLIRAAGRMPMQRDTFYRTVSDERRAAAGQAAPLAPIVQTPIVQTKPRARVPA